MGFSYDRGLLFSSSCLKSPDPKGFMTFAHHWEIYWCDDNDKQSYYQLHKSISFLTLCNLKLYSLVKHFTGVTHYNFKIPTHWGPELVQLSWTKNWKSSFLLALSHIISKQPTLLYESKIVHSCPLFQLLSVLKYKIMVLHSL